MELIKSKKRKIAELIVLSVIVVVFQFAGNTIRIGEFSISLILLPVVVGAVLCGPLAGAWLGFLFGTILMLTGETDAFTKISVFYTFIDTAIRGATVGFAAGMVYSSLSKKKEDLAIILASITAPVVNTGIFIILTPILFYGFLESIMGAGNVFSGMIKNYVSINFLIELALNMVLTPILIRFIKLIDKKTLLKSETKKGGRKMLAARLTVALMMLGILICLVSSVSEYRNYQKSIEKQYSDLESYVLQTNKTDSEVNFIREYMKELDVARTEVKKSVHSDIIHSIVMMICIEIIFITLYSYYISYRVIDPINRISSEVSGFVKNENKSCGLIGSINTNDEIQQLAEDITKMEKDIGNYIANITEITAERERIKAELDVATKIQADMLPSVFPAFPDRKDFDIYASMKPAKEVGGDFYDFFMIDDDHLVLVIADVSDKGVPAALFMVVTKTLIKNQATFTCSPKEILEAVNNQLCTNNTSRMFVTAWLCIFEISTGRCVASNAGHEYPAIRYENGAFELLKDSHGFVLGGIKNSNYSEYEFMLKKGDSIFVYTDGVAEAENIKEETFGTERMLDALNIDREASPSESIANVQSVIDDFVKDAPQFDDITMLCVKRSK